MPGHSITSVDIKMLTPPAKGNQRHPVKDCPGLFLTITAKGARSWQFRYSNPEGRERLFTIGGYPIFAMSAAKTEWKDLRRRVSLGEDPLEEVQEVRRAPIVRDLWQRYEEDHLPSKRPSTIAQNRLHARTIILPKLGNMKVEAVEQRHIDAIHRSLKQKPIKANRVRSLLSHMFTLARQWGWREGGNPVEFVKRYPEDKRQRFLSEQEVARLIEVLNGWPHQEVAKAVRLLLLTGARRNEIVLMRWEDLDLEHGIWNRSSQYLKQKRQHSIPLSAPALELLASIERGKSPLVFPGKHGEGCNLRGQWRAIRKAAGLDGVRVHDLRHSFASLLASSGQSLQVIQQLLGHASFTTTLRYSHLTDSALRAATERVAAVVASASKPTADVVKLRG